MALEVGGKVPDVKLKVVTEAGQQETSTGELFKGKKAVVFGVPGAFTPTCSAKHLPGYVAQYADLKGKGVDLVVDPVGGSVLQSSLKCLAYRGCVSWVGSAGRETATVDLSTLAGGNRSVTSVFLEVFTPRGYDMIQSLIDDAARGELQVVIDKVFPLAEAAAARILRARRHAS